MIMDCACVQTGNNTSSSRSEFTSTVLFSYTAGLKIFLVIRSGEYRGVTIANCGDCPEGNNPFSKELQDEFVVRGQSPVLDGVLPLREASSRENYNLVKLPVEQAEINALR